ncbi:MAG: ABC transporter ATP-binding protein [Planctomycetaceae bacterium]|nr:ABC transporter ATP-binding protein [Planctomycetaceae bacterium]
MNSERDPAVRLRDLSRAHGKAEQRVLALDRIDLDVHEGEFVCLLGASGCGKSTLLHLVAGLDEPTSGELRVAGGQPAVMFQDSALFPWATVEENVSFPMEMRGLAPKARAERIAELLDLVHLTGFAQHRPHQLSGGMRQRAALARALAQDARVLLMDEPFGALDALLRDRLHDELERVWQRTGLTVLFVTHNPREAARLADRVVLLSSRPGRIAQEFEVDIERPRRIDSPEVSQLARKLTDRLKEVIHATADSEALEA